MVAIELPPEVTASFVAEARSYLPAIVESLVVIENEAKLADAYRFAHTIKSSAAMMGQTSLSQVAELLEGDLEGFQLGEPAAPGHLAQLGRSIERIGQLLDAVSGEPVDVEAIIAAEVADRTAGFDLPHADEATSGLGNASEPAAADLQDVDHTDVPPTFVQIDIEDAGAPLDMLLPADIPESAPDSMVPAAIGASLEDLAIPVADTPIVPAAAAVSGGKEEILRFAQDDKGARPEDRKGRPEDKKGLQGNKGARPEDNAAARPDARVAQEEERGAQQGERRAQEGERGAARGEQATKRSDASTGGAQALDESPGVALTGESDGVSSLVDELAESVLALGREIDRGPADLGAHHEALAGWLSRFEQAAGLRSAAPATAASATRLQEQTTQYVELDPAVEAEQALRQAIEAELRFQIEEEVRAQIAREAPPLPRASTSIRVPASTSWQTFVPSAAGLSLRSSRQGEADAQHRLRSASDALAPFGEPQPSVAATPDDAEIDAETREVFALEAAEHLKRIDADAATLAADPANSAARAALRRSVHTLKGAAAMMGFQAVATLAHSLEDRLDGASTDDATAAAVEAGGASGAPAVFPVGEVLQDLDRLEALVQRCIGGTDTGEPAAEGAPTAAPVTPAASFAPAAGAPSLSPAAETSPAVMAVPVRLDQLDDLLRVAGESSVSVAALPALLSTASGALVELRQTVARVQSLVATLTEQRDDAAAAPLGQNSGVAHAMESSAEAAQFDPLELDRYTSADYLLHDLAEIAADAHSAEREIASALESIAEVATAQRHQAAAIQERLLGVRLVSLDELGGRLNRAARGVASRRNKEIGFIFTGGEVAVDRAILDAVSDALLHLVRNASDHGIETPDERRRRGKSAIGTIQVTARQEQGEVVVEVTDDGRGVDPARMGAAALAAGLDPETLTLEQAVELMFRPGVSTAGQVDDVSGRGVGLDVVREAIDRVRGTIEVVTEPGAGTIFSLRFPVTLAQARVVMLEAAGNPLALPAASVRRVARLSETATERRGEALVARHAGESFAVADLAMTLGIAADGARPDDPAVIFVEAAGRRAALVAAKVGSQEDVVIRPLGTHLRTPRGVSGAALLRDGRVAVLLHLPDILSGSSSARGVLLPARADLVPAGRSTVSRAPASMQILVVDDSPTIRKLLVRMLKDLGWRPVEAKDGVEALERIRVNRPDAVLADIEMPHLDGYGLLAALRAKPETANLPVVMLTSRSADRHRQRAMELGANGYLTKPYRPADVVDALRQVGVRAADMAAA